MSINVCNDRSMASITSLPSGVTGSSLVLISEQTASSSATIDFTSADLDIILDITDISNQKVRFSVEHHDSNTSTSGDSTQDSTYFRFIRLGDT